jgi:peptide chain release factor 1
MYQRYCRSTGLTCEVLEAREGEPGLRAATLKISGTGAGRFSGEGGTHRIQHKTRSRKQDRIHTSTATVAILPLARAAGAAAPGTPSLDMNQVKVEPFRSSGPGGQHRNKSECAIRATHLPSGETATIDGRSQKQNRESALELLAARVAAGVQEVEREGRQKLRSEQTMAERARAVRTYDEIRDVIRCEGGKKVRGVKRVLDGDLAPLMA